MLPVIECGCKYRIPARYDEVLEVTAKITEMKGATVTIDYDIKKQETGELLVTGFTKHAVTNIEFKPIRLRDKNKVLYDRLLEG
jgi:acyl-CoA thioester hydrolase